MVKNKDTKIAEKEFDFLFGEIRHAYRQFELVMELRKHRLRLRGYRTFLTTASPALNISYLSILAKALEFPNVWKDPVISVFTITRHRFNKHKETIEKIKKIRNKILMHNDQTALDSDKLFEQVKLGHAEQRSLFHDLIDFLEEQRVSFGIQGSLLGLKIEARKYARRAVKEMMNVNK